MLQLPLDGNLVLAPLFWHPFPRFASCFWGIKEEAAATVTRQLKSPRSGYGNKQLSLKTMGLAHVDGFLNQKQHLTEKVSVSGIGGSIAENLHMVWLERKTR